MNNDRNNDKKSNIMLWIVGIVLSFMLFKCTGYTPIDLILIIGGVYVDDDGISAEIAESRAFDATVESMPCFDYVQWEELYKECLSKVNSKDKTSVQQVPVSGNLSSCPYGCDYQKPGCDIKGNISFGSGDKIYHLPGMEYYEQTVINSEYGEKWFCTEEEARANGWRRSRSD